ncbi:MAG TPA: lysylphosphatidylglycerol synthase transmembrane domain-containing protein [bacterium]|nr:lysylphosphatidylglycerol synthase transmembrane domain-containing protein [bacterium]
MSPTESGAPIAAAAPPAPARAMTHPSARWITYALSAGGVVILVLFGATTNLQAAVRALRDVRPFLFALAVLAVPAQIVVRAVRWRYMVRRLTDTTISGRFAAVSVVCGVAAGSMTPGRSFELAKAVMLRDAYGVGLGLSVSAMLIERLLDIVALVAGLLLAAVMLPRQTVLANTALPVLIAVIVLGTALLAGAPDHVRAGAAVLLRGVPFRALRNRALAFVDLLCTSIAVSRRRHTLGALLALTALGIALDFARVIAVFGALRVALPPQVLVFTYVGAMILGMALLVPGGVGVTEVSQAGLIAVLAPHAVATAVARSGVLIDRIVSYYAVLVAGGILLMAYHRYHRVIR